MTGVRVDHGSVAGTFSLDGQTWEVENNIWVLGNDEECLVVDAPHEAGPILDLVGDRRLVAIVCTHAHDDHVRAVSALRQATGAPAYLHPGDRMLWDVTVDAPPEEGLADGQHLQVAGVSVHVLHTPGHSPGGCCLYVPDLKLVFTGDTLFQGGPGATGRSHSSFPAIVESISQQLFALPDETIAHTGHGPSTSIGAERPDLAVWLARGH